MYFVCSTHLVGSLFKSGKLLLVNTNNLLQSFLWWFLTSLDAQKWLNGSRHPSTWSNLIKWRCNWKLLMGCLDHFFLLFEMTTTLSDAWPTQWHYQTQLSCNSKSYKYSNGCKKMLDYSVETDGTSLWCWQLDLTIGQKITTEMEKLCWGWTPWFRQWLVAIALV